MEMYKYVVGFACKTKIISVISEVCTMCHIFTVLSTELPVVFSRLIVFINNTTQIASNFDL